MTAYGGLEVWRGSVNTWECDDMGHMNVRFYVARATEGLVGLASAIGLKGAFKANSPATVVVKDHHIRFLREALSRTPLHMVGGILDIDECEARFLQLLIHSDTGDLAASFQTRVTHVTSRDERPFPWSPQVWALADSLKMSAPERAAPRSLDLVASGGMATLAEADRLGLIRLGAGAFGPEDCDTFGRLRPDVFIGRVSDGLPALAAALRVNGDGTSVRRPVGVGGAVLEYRVAYLASPKAGDRFEIRSGLAGVDDRSQRIIHWMLDPETGRPWGSAEAVAIALDLNARKIIPISADDQLRLRAHIHPQLRF